jgi:hypothetical protein
VQNEFKPPVDIFILPAVFYDQTVNRVLCLGVETGQWIRSMEEMAAMQKRHPWFRKPDRGRSFFEPFSSGGSEANQTIQKAILAAIKASLDAHKIEICRSVRLAECDFL